MGNWYGAILAVLLAAAAVHSAPPDVPKEVRANPGQPVRVTIKDGADVGYATAFDDADAFFDELAARPGQRRFVFQTNTPGRYVVVFWTKGETEGVRTTIIVGDPVPVPVPPGPMPPQPTPTDPFVKSVAAAYASETAPDRLASVQRLASIYRVAAKSTVNLVTVKTNADLVADMHAASRTFPELADGKIPAVRKAIGARLNTTLPSVAAIDRALAAKELNAVADALESIK